MAALTLIAEPFPDWEAQAQSAGARDLAAAIAAMAPRSCSARFLLARGSEAPEFRSPVLTVDHLPLRASVLPLVWQTGATARPLDGEFVHAPTPMVPLRSRGDDDGSQTSVMIPHSVAWEAPELMQGNQARLFRAFAKRAVRLADVILTPTHATARVLQETYGAGLPVQVMQLAAPAEFRRAADSAERRAVLGLPPRYTLTTATPGDRGRLEWLFDAMRADPDLPHLVVLEGLEPGSAQPAQAGGVSGRAKGGAQSQAQAQARANVDAHVQAQAALSGGAELQETGGGVQVLEHDPAPESGLIPGDLRGRVTTVRPRELADVGAIIAGAGLLLRPQDYSGTGFTELGALGSSVPVLHSGHPATAELVLDGGIGAETQTEFAAEYHRLFTEPGALARLTVLARDRSRSFSWNAAAWQLWETHANL